MIVDVGMLVWLRAPLGSVMLRYDDVREAMVREKSIFLAGGAWWEEPPAAFRSKPPSLRGRRSCWRTRECGRPIAAAAWGSCGI